MRFKMGRELPKHFSNKHLFCLIISLSISLWSLPFNQVLIAGENESVSHFKMFSTVEYAGQGSSGWSQQFRSQVETLFTVNKVSLSNDTFSGYHISTNDFDLNSNSGRQSSNSLSFVLNNRTKQLSGLSEDLSHLEILNRHIVGSLIKPTDIGLGKKWTQSFSMSFPGNYFLPDTLKFNMSAIQIQTKSIGKMIAVKAVSEPFAVQVSKGGAGIGFVHCQTSTVYLFDPYVFNSASDEIYLSISVFDATTSMRGIMEKLRHEVSTYKASSDGIPVDLSGLGVEFESFVRELDLTGKSLDVVRESPLPRWAQFEILDAAQISNMCATIACEGALNPVVTRMIPSARVIGLQSTGRLGTGKGYQSSTLDRRETVSSSLNDQVFYDRRAEISGPPAFSGLGEMTTSTLILGAASVGMVAIATDNNKGDESTDNRVYNFDIRSVFIPGTFTWTWGP